mmetsp:Transcript_27059/g.38785  ORF Transcript_27059/g.38785 Transcript_27059/m.38785 type:complete len:83 (-) Transcript_27059:18-266(-)
MCDCRESNDESSSFFKNERANGLMERMTHVLWSKMVRSSWLSPCGEGHLGRFCPLLVLIELGLGLLNWSVIFYTSQTSETQY